MYILEKLQETFGLEMQNMFDPYSLKPHFKINLVQPTLAVKQVPQHFLSYRYSCSILHWKDESILLRIIPPETNPFWSVQLPNHSNRPKKSLDLHICVCTCMETKKNHNQFRGKRYATFKCQITTFQG